MTTTRSAPPAIRCPHRADPSAERSQCRLAERVVPAGATSVHVQLCAACQEAGCAPDLETPNRYLASAVINGADAARDRGLMDAAAAAAITRRFGRYVRLVTVKAPAKDPRAARCVHLGRTVQATRSTCVRNDLCECDHFRDPAGTKLQVIQNGQCRTCPAYESEDGP